MGSRDGTIVVTWGSHPTGPLAEVRESAVAATAAPAAACVPAACGGAKARSSLGNNFTCILEKT